MFSLDEEVWREFIPKPVIAVILLYQVNKDHDMLYPNNVYYVGEKDKIEQPFFLRQTIGNACGTVALLHALCNNVETKPDGVGNDFKEGSFLDTYYSKFRNATPDEKAAYLYDDVVVEQNHKEIAESSEARASGKNPQGSAAEKLNPPPVDPNSLYCHFVTYVSKNGCLW